MASLQLLCTVGGNQARLDARTEFKILEHYNNVRDRVMTVGLVMTVWNIKTAHKQNLLRTSIAILTVITLSLTLVVYYNYLYTVGSN